MNVHVLSWKARELAIPFDGFSITRGNNATAVDLLIFPNRASWNQLIELLFCINFR
jgi:hypothetical protein